MRLGDTVAARTWGVVLLSGTLLASACRFGYEILPEQDGGGSAGSTGGDDSGGNSGTAGSGPGGETACDDGIANGTESDVDCGGDCTPCTAGDSCTSADDCLSSVCDGGVCADPSCTDGVRNQGEIGVDCGGPSCPCCDPGAFGTPEQITGLGLTVNLYGPALSSDGSRMYFGAFEGDEDLYVASRTDRGVAFSMATPLAELNGEADEGTPHLSQDGLWLSFHSDRTGSLGARDLMAATRASVDEPFSSPGWLGINSTAVDQNPAISTDQRRLLFASTRSEGAGASDLWLAERSDTSEAFSVATNLVALNTSYTEDGPSLSTDELTLYFNSNRPESLLNDIWVSTRSDRSVPFDTPVRLGVVSTPFEEIDAFLTADGRELFFASNASGSWKIWRSIRDCL